eukprot:403338202
MQNRTNSTQIQGQPNPPKTLNDSDDNGLDDCDENVRTFDNRIHQTESKAIGSSSLNQRMTTQGMRPSIQSMSSKYNSGNQMVITHFLYLMLIFTEQYIAICIGKWKQKWNNLKQQHSGEQNTKWVIYLNNDVKQHEKQCWSAKQSQLVVGSRFTIEQDIKSKIFIIQLAIITKFDIKIWNKYHQYTKHKCLNKLQTRFVQSNPLSGKSSAMQVRAGGTINQTQPSQSPIRLQTKQISQQQSATYQIKNERNVHNRASNIKTVNNAKTQDFQKEFAKSPKGISTQNKAINFEAGQAPKTSRYSQHQFNTDPFQSENKVMRILRAKMSSGMNNGAANTSSMYQSQTPTNNKANNHLFNSASNQNQLKQNQGNNLKITNKYSNISQNETVNLDTSNMNNQNTNSLRQNQDLKIYKDGKVVAVGGGVALFQQNQSKLNRFSEEKAVSNMNANQLNKQHKMSVQITSKALNNMVADGGSRGSNTSHIEPQLDPFVQRQLIDEARRKQQREQILQEKKEREERMLLDSIQGSQHMRNGSEQSQRINSFNFEHFYKSQLDFKAKVDGKIQNQKFEDDLKFQQMSSQACPKPCKGSQRILQKYNYKKDSKPINSEELDGGNSPVAEESSKGTVSQVYDRLYNNKSLIPTIENRKLKQQEEKHEMEQHKNQVKKSLHDQQEYMERLFTNGTNTSRLGDDSILKRHNSKWGSTSTFQPELATSKTKTDKMIFDRLRKDFHQFFNLDLYYASVCYASKQAYNQIDESIIEKAANYVSGGQGMKEDMNNKNRSRQVSSSGTRHGTGSSLGSILYSSHVHTKSVKTLHEMISVGAKTSQQNVNSSVLSQKHKLNSQRNGSSSQDRNNKNGFRMQYGLKKSVQEPNQSTSDVSQYDSKPNIKNEAAFKANMLKGTPIRYTSYMQVMHNLGFLQSPTPKTAVEEQNLSEIWKMLGGNKVSNRDRTIKAENLFVILCALLNIRLSVLVQRHEEMNLPEGHRFEGFLCFDDYENAHFTTYDDITKIHRKFKVLAMNRLNRKQSEQTSHSRQLSKEPQQQQNFKISDGSKQWLDNATRTRSHSYSQRSFKLGFGEKTEKIDYVTIDGIQIPLNEIKERFKVRAQMMNANQTSQSISQGDISQLSSKIGDKNMKPLQRNESGKNMSTFANQHHRVKPKISTTNVESGDMIYSPTNSNYKGPKIVTNMITQVYEEGNDFQFESYKQSKKRDDKSIGSWDNNSVDHNEQINANLKNKKNGYIMGQGKIDSALKTSEKTVFSMGSSPERREFKAKIDSTKQLQSKQLIMPDNDLLMMSSVMDNDSQFDITNNDLSMIEGNAGAQINFKSKVIHKDLDKINQDFSLE